MPEILIAVTSEKTIICCLFNFKSAFDTGNHRTKCYTKLMLYFLPIGSYVARTVKYTTRRVLDAHSLG